MLNIEIGEPEILKRADVTEEENGEITFWAHINMRIADKWIELTSDGEFDNSLFGEFKQTYKRISEEEAVKEFVSYMKENG